jgi:hypothetical protein
VALGTVMRNWSHLWNKNSVNRQSWPTLNVPNESNVNSNKPTHIVRWVKDGHEKRMYWHRRTWRTY